MSSPSQLDHQPGQFMAEEIVSQPDCWAQLAGRLDWFEALRRPGECVAVIGCGTSWFVAQVVAALREQRGYGVTDAFAASEAPLAGRSYDAIIAISRSGTTSEIIAGLENAPVGMRKIVVVADASSPVGLLADEIIEMPFADERSVVQTRFASTALALARAAYGDDLAAMITAARQVLAEPTPTTLVDAEQLTCLGTGWTIGLAHEAALKMREASQSWTESYPAMEFRHGPMSISTSGRAVWAFGQVPDGLPSEVARTGASFVHSEIDPLAELVRAHLVALARSRSRGLDADTPRHLTRSVILAQ